MITEQDIRDALDGWFYSLDFERGNVIATPVRKNHIPNHVPKYLSEFDQDKPHFNNKKFTPDQDDTIIRMREQGYIWQDISKAVRHDGTLTRARYIIICRERGIRPLLDVRKKKFTPEQRRQLIEMRARGVSYAEIGSQIGMTEQQARDLYRDIARHSPQELAA